MELQHVNVKIFVDGEMTVDPARFIEVFHGWVAEQSMNEMMIDVADYRHVPDGPGVVMVGHEADYAMDNAGGRDGLLYNRKAALDVSNEDRIRQAVTSAASACQRLEAAFADGDGLKFSRQEFVVFINDRALAPNTSETYQACKPELESSLTSVLGHDDFTLEHHSDPRSRFGVGVKVAKLFDLASLAGG